MNINKILLIAPCTTKIWREDIKNKLGTAPLGLAALSSFLKFHGYQVKMIDMLVDATSASDLKAIIEKYMPDVIGISASYTDSINTTYKITKYLRKLSNAILIAGGVHVTFNPEEALKNGFDYVIKNEGESTLIELLEYLKAESGYFRNIRGLVYKKDGYPFKNPPRDFITGLDTLPFPDLLSFNLTQYVTPLSIITSRGCPGDCIYCASRAMSGKKYRMRSAESVFSEVYYFSSRILNDNRLYKSYLAIYDDTFTVSRKRLVKFCSYMIESKLNIIPWKCESRIDILDEEIIQLMKEAGCFAMHIGIESANQHIIDSLNKHISLSKVELVLSLLKKYNIKPLCSFIIGNHLDTTDTLRITKDFICHIIKNYGAQVAVSPNTPLPGTELNKNAEQYNIRIHSNNWDDFSLMKVIISTKFLRDIDIRNIYYSIIDEINSIGG